MDQTAFTLIAITGICTIVLIIHSVPLLYSWVKHAINVVRGAPQCKGDCNQGHKSCKCQ